MRVTGRYPLSFYLALVANFFFFAGFQWTFATLPGYIQDLGGGAAEIGLAYGLFSLSAVLARPAIGWLVDRLGRKPVLLAGAAMFALSPALYALFHSLWAFLGVRIFHGVGIAAFTTAYTAFVADLASPGRRGEAIGLSGVTNNLGMLFTPALGVLVVARWGYAAHFVIAAGITLVSLLLLLPTREPEHITVVRSDHSSLWTVARLRPVWVAAFGITGLAVAYGAVLGFLAPFAAERGLYATGGYFSAFALTMITSQSSAGWLSDRVGRRAVAVPGLAIVMLAMVGLSMAGTDTGLLAAGALFGLSWGLARAGIDTAVVDAVVPDMRGSAIGFLYTCFDMGVGMGSFGLGVIAQAGGYPAALYTSAIWAAVALAGYVLWGRRKSPMPGSPSERRF
jgi:MFS family permease